MPTDRQRLNLLAAVLCGIGSLAALADGLASGGLRSPYQDRQESRGGLDPA